jgi:hypothetical protein
MLTPGRSLVVEALALVVSALVVQAIGESSQLLMSRQ